MVKQMIKVQWELEEAVALFDIYFKNAIFSILSAFFVCNFTTPFCDVLLHHLLHHFRMKIYRFIMIFIELMCCQKSFNSFIFKAFLQLIRCYLINIVVQPINV